MGRKVSHVFYTDSSFLYPLKVTCLEVFAELFPESQVSSMLTTSQIVTSFNESDM